MMAALLASLVQAWNKGDLTFGETVLAGLIAAMLMALIVLGVNQASACFRRNRAFKIRHRIGTDSDGQAKLRGSVAIQNGYHILQCHIVPSVGTELDVFNVRFVRRRWWRLGVARWPQSDAVTFMGDRKVVERHGANWSLGSNPNMIEGLRLNGTRPWNSGEPIEIHAKIGAHEAWSGHISFRARTALGQDGYGRMRFTVYISYETAPAVTTSGSSLASGTAASPPRGAS
jgi:hypothetical protein